MCKWFVKTELNENFIIKLYKIKIHISKFTYNFKIYLQFFKEKSLAKLLFVFFFSCNFAQWFPFSELIFYYMPHYENMLLLKFKNTIEIDIVKFIRLIYGLSSPWAPCFSNAAEAFSSKLSNFIPSHLST